MAYEKKPGDFTLNKKTSKGGNAYWSGKITLNGTEYWITLFDGEKDGKIVASFSGCHEAGRQTNVMYQHIADCCRGTRKTAGGFLWKYALGI